MNARPFSSQLVSGNQVYEWFCDVRPGKKQKRPDASSCERLADFFNTGPATLFNAEVEAQSKIEKRAKVMVTANKLLFALEEWKHEFGDQDWHLMNECWPLDLLADTLEQIGAAAHVPDEKTKLGNPGLSADWRPAGRAFANAVNAALSEVGIRPQSALTATSDVVYVSTRAINIRFGLALTEDGLVTGMRPRRDRSRPRSYEERFPDSKRLVPSP